MTKEELNVILKNHELWLNSEGGERADLYGADLYGADLSGADLCGVDLCGADLRDADLRDADLRDADLRDADLRGTNLTQVKGLISPIDYLKENFESTSDGYIVYKTFGGTYYPNPNWIIKPNSIINEIVNPEKQCDCGSGINVATLDWVKDHYTGAIWKCLIRWEWLAGVVVPYNTSGKIRCERVQLVEIVRKRI